MKIAIPIESNKEKSKISAVFGRCKHFALYDTIKHSYEFIDNPFFNDKMRVGANVVWLLKQQQIEGYVAYEFGLKLQNQASLHKIQLILIKNTIETLRDLEKLIQKA